MNISALDSVLMQVALFKSRLNSLLSLCKYENSLQLKNNKNFQRLVHFEAH